MNPRFLTKTGDDRCLFEILTIGHQKLIGRAMFGDGEFNCEYFLINRYEKIPIESVKEVCAINDFYYSETMAQRHGWNYVDGEKYTEAVPTGVKPACPRDDLIFVKTTATGEIKIGPRKTDWASITELNREGLWCIIR